MQISKEHIRKNILQTAQSLFYTKGYAKVPMREIASKSHVSLSNIYNYYDSKEKIFQEIVQPAIDDFNRILDEHHGRSGTDIMEMFSDDYLQNLIKEYLSLNKTLIPEPERDKYIAGSLLEKKWIDELRTKYPEGNFIFVIEGVLMYFHEEQVKELLSRLAICFGGGEIWFDVCGTIMTKGAVKPDSLRGHEAQIRSGISNGHIVESWEPRLQLIEQAIYQKLYTRRWGLAMRILSHFPRLSCRFSSLLGYKIKMNDTK